MGPDLLLGGLVVGGSVDPGLLGYRGWFGELAHEAFGVLVVGVGEDLGPQVAYQVGLAVVDVVGRVVADAAVPVFDVVPVEARRAPLPGVGQGTEPVQVIRPVQLLGVALQGGGG